MPKRLLALLFFASCATPSDPAPATPEPADPSGVAPEAGPGETEARVPEQPAAPESGQTAPAPAGILATVQELANNVDVKPYRVSIGNFTYERTGVPGEFANFLSGELSMALGQSDSFAEYARKDLDAIMTEQEMSLSDIVSNTDRPRVGALKAVQGLIVGEYWASGNEANVNLRLIDVESGQILGSTKATLALEELPSRVSVAPTNLERTKKALASFQEGKSRQEFETKLWLDRGDGGVYSKGEHLQVRFQSEVDCYLRLYYLSADDELLMIFPNEHSGRRKLQGGKVHVFPGEGSFDFVVSEPFGTELIYAVASTAPFSNEEESLTSLGGTNEISKVRTRGIKVQAKRAKLSESTCVYTVVE